MKNLTAAAALLAAVSLPACQSTTTVLVRCPPLVAYDQATQAAAADQLSNLQAGSPVRVMIKDYGDLRAQCRAIEAASPTR